MAKSDLDRSKLGEMIGDLDERPYELTTYPGRDGSDGQRPLPFALWALTATETIAAKTRAYDFVSKVLKMTDQHLAWDDYQVIDDCIMAETLAIAMRDPDDRMQPLARNATDVRDRLAPHVQQAIWKQYLTWQQKNSFLDHVEDAARELDELVALGKKRLPLKGRISQLDTLSLRALLLTLVDRHVSLLESSSPDSSSSNDSSHSGSASSASTTDPANTTP